MGKEKCAPTQKEVIDFLKNISHSKNLQGIEIGLFGSYARNEYRTNSDIDIAYKVLNQDIDCFSSAMFLVESIQKEFQKKVSLIEYNEAKEEHKEDLKYFEEDGLDKALEYGFFSNLKKDAIWIGDRQP